MAQGFQRYREGDREVVVDGFLTPVFAPGYRQFVDHALPGSRPQAVRDADTLPSYRPGAPPSARSARYTAARTRTEEAMATFEEYMATPDPWKKAELVRGTVLMRKPGYAAHGLAISAFMRLWFDYSGERSGMGNAERHAAQRRAMRRTVGEILPNPGAILAGSCAHRSSPP